MHSFCKEVEHVKETPSRGPSNQTPNTHGCGVEVIVGVVIAVAVGLVVGVFVVGVVEDAVEDAFEDAVVVVDDGPVTLMRTQPTLSYSRTLSPPSAPPYPRRDS